MLFVILLIVMNSINSIIRVTAIYYNFDVLQMNASGNYIVTITLHSYIQQSAGKMCGV